MVEQGDKVLDETLPSSFDDVLRPGNVPPDSRCEAPIVEDVDSDDDLSEEEAEVRS
jgi:hypothetical protein